MRGRSGQRLGPIGGSRQTGGRWLLAKVMALAILASGFLVQCRCHGRKAGQGSEQPVSKTSEEGERRGSGGGVRGGFEGAGKERSGYAKRRAAMVTHQLQARGVKDLKVLAAMKEVRRHLFVPAVFRDSAYADRPLPIGKKQTISQPYIVAYMTEALGVDGDDRVLEVGTGSGYQAAVLAKIVREVYTIEIVESLAKRAKRILKNAGYDNIHFKVGDGYQGWKDKAPFDAIMVTAAPDHVPAPLKKQLAVGGRLVMPVGNVLLRITKTKDGYKRERLLGVRFVPMTGEAQRR
mgnify:CR=1 FL=1